jgi:pullulanase/glycogen debranching enzyme
MKIHANAQNAINELKASLAVSLDKLARYQDYNRNDFRNSDEADWFQKVYETEQKYADLLKKEIKFRQKKALSDRKKFLEIKQLNWDMYVARNDNRDFLYSFQRQMELAATNRVGLLMYVEKHITSLYKKSKGIDEWLTKTR